MQTPLALSRAALTATKVPALTFSFWVVKIAATTLGETGGDALSMSLGVGYILSTAIFGVLFVGAVLLQVRANRFSPGRYWLTIILTTMVGTTLADFVDRSLGIGYAGGTLVLASLLLASLYAWRRLLGTVATTAITTPQAESFYWLTILFSQTLGTALGDWTADTRGLGYLGSAVLFGGLLLITVLLYYRTQVSRVALFWAAFILTRPLGAVVGDYLDKPTAAGGLALSRFTASAVLLVFIVLTLYFTKPKPAQVTH